jgi:hypothetical protein
MRVLSRPKTPFSESDLLNLDERIAQVEQKPSIVKSRIAVDTAGNPVAIEESAIDSVMMGITDDVALQREAKLWDMIAKGGSENIVPSFYAGGETYIATKETEDVTDTKGIRRAIHTISNYYNTLGIFRDDFDKALNDKMARNAYYAIGEKAIMDYFGTLEWTVKDTKDGTKVDKAFDFLHDPNPQDSFDDIKKMTVRDLIRYDAGVIVKTFNKGGYLHEIKSYMGTEFWREQDRVPLIINVPVQSAVNLKGNNRGKYFDTSYPTYQGWWSHGYTERFWQRSRTGVYIPFQPEEVCYFMMYPRTDGIYGTDFIKFLRYQMQYLIDSTKAAGMTFENGMVPSIVWEHPEMRSIAQLRQRIIEAKFNNQGVNKFGSVLHAVNGETVKTLAQNLHDMQWLEGQKFVAQLIWAMWGFSQDEFLGGGANRATAYVKRNITKSRMLYPLMDYFEQKINREILPYIKGYRKSWKFEFLKDVDLDDRQKIAQIRAVNISTLGQLVNMNFPIDVSLKLADIGDDLTTDEVENITETLSQAQMAAMQAQVSGTAGTDVMQGKSTGTDPNGEVGRYNGEGAGTTDYMPINFSDYGMGGEQTETRTGDADEKQFRKATLKVEGRDGNERNLDCDLYEVETKKGIITKAKVYVTHPGEAPSGRSVKRGNRGAYYYITTAAHHATPKNEQAASGKKHRHPGWGQENGAQQQSSGSMSAPGSSGGGGMQTNPVQATISGQNIGVVLSVQNGILVGEMMQTEETNNFLLYCAEEAKGESDAIGIFEVIVEFAKESGLEVT